MTPPNRDDDRAKALSAEERQEVVPLVKTVRAGMLEPTKTPAYFKAVAALDVLASRLTAAEQDAKALNGRLLIAEASFSSRADRCERFWTRAESDERRARELEEALDERLSVEAADQWLSHRFHQVCDERDRLKEALQQIRYGLWGDMTDRGIIASMVAIAALALDPQVCACNGYLDGKPLPPKTDCPKCRGTGRQALAQPASEPAREAK